MADDAARIEQLEAELAALRVERNGLAHEVQHLRPALTEALEQQAAIAIENARLFQELDQRSTELRESNRQVSEALEQQTATAEILRIIASSPADVQPVLDAVAKRAADLCDTYFAAVALVEGDHLRAVTRFVLPAAQSGGALPSAFVDPNPDPGRRIPIDGSVAGRAVTERRTVHVHDIEALEPEEYPFTRVGQGQAGRTLLTAPLLREGVAIGAIILRRMEVHPFTEQQIALLETFADQAVIAIENARLFEELEQRNAELTEALDRQTATADVLRVIATSPTDLQGILQAIVESATRLCAADTAAFFRVEGDEYVRMANLHPASNILPIGMRVPLTPGSWIGRAVLDKRTVRHDDVEEVIDQEYPITARTYRERLAEEGDSARRVRSMLVVPLLRKGDAIGALMVNRHEVRPFTDGNVALLETFADQAVIAIENARLFEELQERTAQLSEALTQQTALAEVLRVIASSPTDLRGVLQNVVESAARLCAADNVGIWQADGSSMERMVNSTSTRGPLPGTRTPLDRGMPSGRVILDGQTIHILDLESVRETEFATARLALRPGQRFASRSYLAVPLLREGVAIGAMSVERGEVRAFTGTEIALMETFADQAVIAIENARLFEQLEERTRELGRSVDELEALGQVSQAVSSSLDLQEVLTTIVAHAVRLAEADGGTVYELDESAGEFQLRAAYQMPDELLASIQQTRPRLSADSFVGRVALSGRAEQTADLLALPDVVESPVREVLRSAGFRALIGVPLIREQRILGVLTIRRRTPGEFSPAVVELLQTFANQSVLAIQNARLFQEVEAKSRELEVASQHKSQFLANMSHELRTPLNAVIGYSEMLQEELDDLGQDALVPDVEKINAAGRHLLGLINDILDLSKIEAGKMELFLEPVDVRALVQDVTATVGPLIAKNGNQLQVSVATDTGDMQADATKIRQILFNLLGNAAKFTDHGTITLTVARESGDWLVFTVVDTGIGMTEEQLGRLFQAFTQAEASTTRSFGGTGLGLTLVRHFAEMMGGEVGVSSTAGVGSSFTVRLPAVVTTPAQRALPVLDDADTALPDVGRRNAPVVLVIDDDANSRELLRRHLEADGVRVVEAASGEEGLRLTHALRPSLITLDVLMPGLDGWAVLGALKDDPATAEIPVILLTILDDRDLSFALGAADYLTKPIDRDRLLRAVAKHVRHDEPLTARRALIVEDDPATREMLGRLLQRDGWSIEEAADGRVGLERVTAAVPDLILLDLMMPELDGFGFLERLRSEPAWRTIPVLVITATDLTPQERLRLNGWVEQVVQKGAYSRSDLLAEVRALVRASVEHL